MKYGSKYKVVVDYPGFKFLQFCMIRIYNILRVIWTWNSNFLIVITRIGIVVQSTKQRICSIGHLLWITNTILQETDTERNTAHNRRMKTSEADSIKIVLSFQRHNLLLMRAFASAIHIKEYKTFLSSDIRSSSSSIQLKYLEQSLIKKY